MRQKLYVEAHHCLLLYCLHRQHSLRQPKTKTAEATRLSKDEEEERQYKTKRQGISAHYAFPSRPTLSVQHSTNCQRNVALPSHEETNPQQKFVPNFGARSKLDNPHGDHRGSDVYLAALDSLIENLIKTPVHDTANDPTSHGDSTNTISCTGTAANGHTSRVHRIHSLRRKRSISLGNPAP